MIAKAIAEARADALERGLDEQKVVRRAVRCPYKHGWLAQLWYDECAKQLGSPKGRIKRRGAPSTTNAGQGRLFDDDR